MKSVSGTGHITFSFGPEQTVFTYATDACEPLDVPDTPVHAMGLPTAAYSLTTAMRHTSMECSVQYSHPCTGTVPRLFQPILSITRSGWSRCIALAAPQHGLIHNEFHDPIAPDYKGGDRAEPKLSPLCISLLAVFTFFPAARFSHVSV